MYISCDIKFRYDTMPFSSKYLAKYDYSAAHHANLGRALQRSVTAAVAVGALLCAAVQSCNDKSKGFSGDGEKRRRGIGLGCLRLSP